MTNIVERKTYWSLLNLSVLFTMKWKIKESLFFCFDPTINKKKVCDVIDVNKSKSLN